MKIRDFNTIIFNYRRSERFDSLGGARDDFQEENRFYAKKTAMDGNLEIDAKSEFISQRFEYITHISREARDIRTSDKIKDGDDFLKIESIVPIPENLPRYIKIIASQEAQPA